MFAIRPLQPEDQAALQKNCWPTRPPIEIAQLWKQVERFREHCRGEALVVIEDGEAIAFGILTAWPNRGEISDLIVQEEKRGQGIGTQMIRALCDLAYERFGISAIEIGVFSNNNRALLLYERLGFVPYRSIQLHKGAPAKTIIYLQKILPSTPSPSRGS